MQTTIEIPDALFKQASDQAAERGIELNVLIEEALRAALEADYRVDVPLIHRNDPGSIAFEDVQRAEEEQIAEEDRLNYGGAS